MSVCDSSGNCRARGRTRADHLPLFRVVRFDLEVHVVKQNHRQKDLFSPYAVSEPGTTSPMVGLQRAQGGVHLERPCPVHRKERWRRQGGERGGKVGTKRNGGEREGKEDRESVAQIRPRRSDHHENPANRENIRQTGASLNLHERFPTTTLSLRSCLGPDSASNTQPASPVLPAGGDDGLLHIVEELGVVDHQHHETHREDNNPIVCHLNISFRPTLNP